MAKKSKPDRHGFVFSTDPDFQFQSDSDDQATKQPAEQKLRVRLETKHRAGKAATIVDGFIGRQEDLEELGKKLKSFVVPVARQKMENSLCRAINGRRSFNGC